MVGEIGHWNYFMKTMRQIGLGTVPKEMFANSANIEPTNRPLQSVALHVNALFVASMKMILPQYYTTGPGTELGLVRRCEI